MQPWKGKQKQNPWILLVVPLGRRNDVLGTKLKQYSQGSVTRHVFGQSSGLGRDGHRVRP